MNRDEIIEYYAAGGDVPVLILGGGVNGTGLLRELAVQGVDALLVDKADFVAGASSKSSRMIHGGLRYLENREFALVTESIMERNRLLTNAAHYVAPLKTAIPLTSWFGGLLRSMLIFMGFKIRPGERGVVPVKFGLWFYDFVTRKNRKTPTHYITSRTEALRKMPAMRPDIVATATYWDAWITEAERLCIELIQDARAANAGCRALNYVRPRGLDGASVVIEDLLTGRTVSVRPRVVVNATGAWVDLANRDLGLETDYMGGTKGSHLVVDNPQLCRTLDGQMVYYQHADGRVCIVFPFMGKVIMGSTDIRIEDPDAARCDEDEVRYMLDTLRGVLPNVEIRRDQIVHVFCGVRPLQASGSKVTAVVSRGHSIQTVEPDERRPFAVMSLVGGKWTTFRSLAEQSADAVLARLGRTRKCRTDDMPIGGGRGCPAGDRQRQQWIADLARQTALPETRVADLLTRYGSHAETYARQAAAARAETGNTDAAAGNAGAAAGNAGAGAAAKDAPIEWDETPLKNLPDYSVGEIRRIAAEEYVQHLDDLVCRRSVIALLGRATEPALTELAQIAGEVLGWDPARQAAEVARALAELRMPE
jgi:glycerol-3-phosphate dehydrogenase